MSRHLLTGSYAHDFVRMLYDTVGGDASTCKDARDDLMRRKDAARGDDAAY